MSNLSISDRSAGAVISDLSSDYYTGNAQPIESVVPSRESDEYILERASISSVLIARATAEIVEPTDSHLGYRFVHKVPSKIKSIDLLQGWVQAEAHTALDELINTDPNLNKLADRYQDLIKPAFGLGNRSTRSGREQTILFQQSVSEPLAWLRMASIAASHKGIRMVQSQAMPYLEGKLKTMQLGARQDIALQNVRGAVLEAAEVMGTMLTPEDEESALRYKMLSSFVLSRADHKLQGSTFGELHEVAQDSDGRITVSEREEGFGPISSKHEMPAACPASYRFNNGEAAKLDNSALFKLLRAGVAAMKQKDLFAEALTTRRVSLPTAAAELDERLKADNGNTVILVSK